MQNTFTNSNKARKILDDYYRSELIKGITQAEQVSIRKQLGVLWNAIDNTEITSKLSQDEVEALLGKPIEQIDDIWFYPSTFKHHYYTIAFKKGFVGTTDFVTVNFV